MNFFCARCDAPLPYGVGLCPSCGQVFPERVPAHDASRYSGAGAITWPVRRPSVSDILTRHLENTGDLISPPILLTAFAFLLMGMLVAAHWLLARQLHRLEHARADIGSVPHAAEGWPDHSLLFLVFLAAGTLAVMSYGLARWRRMRKGGRLSVTTRIRSLAVREGVGMLSLIGVLAWFAAGVQAQDRLAAHWVAAASQAVALAAPAPDDADTSGSGSPTVPATKARIAAEDRIGEDVYHDAMAAIQRLRRQDSPISTSTIAPSLTRIRQAEAAIERDGEASPSAHAAAQAALRQLDADRRRLTALP